VSAKRRWPAVVIISGNKDGDDGGDNDGSEDDNYKEPSDAYHEDDIDMHGIVKVVVLVSKRDRRSPASKEKEIRFKRGYSTQHLQTKID